MTASFESFMSTVFSFLQFLKADLPISLTVDGIFISFKLVQLMNATASIFSSFDGSFTLVRLLHP